MKEVLKRKCHSLHWQRFLGGLIKGHNRLIWFAWKVISGQLTVLLKVTNPRNIVYSFLTSNDSEIRMDIFFGKLPLNTYLFQGNLLRLIKPISEHSIAKYFFCTYDRMKYYVHKSSKPSLKNHQQPLSQWWSLFSTRLLTFHKIVFHNNNSCWHFNFFLQTLV